MLLNMEHEHIHITGIVQGVGMRPFVYREAVSLGISGWVLNAGDGVHIEAHAERKALDAFAAALRSEAPAAASVQGIEVSPLSSDAFTTQDLISFRIIASQDTAEHTTLVSPDIATCPDCLRELFDPADRRYHYPFINCTNCGPRFTIIRSLPYDRSATSMDAFPLCPKCEREYRDPLDRRFHAQPNACFECGPHLTWRERKQGAFAPEGHDGDENAPAAGTTRETSDAIISRCADLLAAGGIVVIKGLGGFHLACNANDDNAVRELRRRKHRSNKPLAVMVRSLKNASDLCEIHSLERQLLTGTVRPIVLLRRKRAGIAAAADGSMRTPELAPSVAFDLAELGVMLPYTPLQHLLLAACEHRGIHALVMTSGNFSEEPIETDDATAWEHLVQNGIADALLGNNRAILARYDDSVVRVVDGETQMVRRARGYAPRPLALPRISVSDDSTPSILACGSEQKATIAFTRELPDGSASCFLSQHIGDVENGATFDAWHAARERFEELFDLHPTALACDLHPRYLASQWAREQARAVDVPLIEIQHHHAHIASVIAEAAAHGIHNPAEPVIGIAFDGTGAGGRCREDGKPGIEPDGSIWGGEFLIADLSGFTRAAHLKPWRLPGGAASVRDSRRNAFSLLSACDLLEHPGAQHLLASLTDEERSVTATMIRRGINSPFTSSMGRFLDAVAAILGICNRATYEGEPAILLEAAAHRVPPLFCRSFPEHLAENYRYERFSSSDASNRGGSGFDYQRNPAERLSAPRDNGQMEAKTSPSSPGESFISVISCQKARHESKKSAIIDPTAFLIRLLDGMSAGEPTAQLARQTHNAVIDMAVEVASELAEQTNIRTVALSGGVFMNRLLLSGIRQGLEGRGVTTLIPHDVPVNDGCISYGQAAIARSKLAQ